MAMRRIDALARSLSTPSRRGLLAALVSSLILPSTLRHNAQAKHKRNFRENETLLALRLLRDPHYRGEAPDVG